MQVNTSKTKVIVFKRGGTLKRCEKWYFDGKRLDSVNIFRYLGLAFSFNGNWKHHAKTSARKMTQASVPVLRFLKQMRSANALKVGLRLFDSMIAPIGLYGSEIFAFSDLSALECASRKFYRKLLAIPSGAPSAGCELLLGRHKFCVAAKLRAVKFWLKIISLDDTSIVKQATGGHRKGRQLLGGNGQVNARLIRPLFCLVATQKWL